MSKAGEAEAVLGNLLTAVNMLQACPEFTRLIPEVRVNLVCALSGAKTPQEVAAIDGRITSVRGMPYAAGTPKWGASDHLSRRVLEVRKYEPAINSAINFKYDQTVEEIAREYCTECGLLFGCLDRTEEPAEVAEQDGSSMPWKVKQLVDASGGVPGLFYEGAGWGKEPLFIALGSNATEVAGIAIEIARRYRHKTA